MVGNQFLSWKMWFLLHFKQTRQFLGTFCFRTNSFINLVKGSKFETSLMKPIWDFHKNISILFLQNVFLIWIPLLGEPTLVLSAFGIKTRKRFGFLVLKPMACLYLHNTTTALFKRSINIGKQEKKPILPGGRKWGYY